MSSFFPEGTPMGRWGSPEARNNPLVAVIEPMPQRAKEAMYGATRRRMIRRGTWNGCAWNQAGAQVGKSVSSTTAAAQVFGCDASIVSRFISVWDRLQYTTNTDANRLLVEALERCLSGQEPHSRVGQTFASTVFKGTQHTVDEQFDKIVQALDMGEVIDNEFVGDMDLMEELLASV
jgi:hypothetical protein